MKKLCNMALAIMVLVVALSGCGKKEITEEPTDTSTEDQVEVVVDTSEYDESDDTDEEVPDSTEDQDPVPDIMERMQEKMDRLQTLYLTLTSEDADINYNYLVDNCEHWTPYFFFGDNDSNVPEYKDGSRSVDDYNSMYVYASFMLDEYINGGNDEILDYHEWFKQFENEQALLQQYNKGGDDEIVSNNMLLLGSLRYALTCVGGSELGEAVLDEGTYQYGERKSAALLTVLVSHEDEMVDSGLRAVFDAQGDLLNIVYVGEGEDTEYMRYTYGEDDWETRYETLQKVDIVYD